MGSRFLRNGNDFTPVDSASLNVSDRLPPGNFGISIDPRSGALYFSKIDDFEMPKKIYGDTLKNADRILNTFDTRPNSTGVLLTGEKGSGKTLLSKQISVQGAVTRSLPTIVVNQPFANEAFFRLIQGIEQPAIVFFDEFEKVYDKDAQPKLLTLLDGVYPSKKLFMFTCNDEFLLNSYMKNRPGRIFYQINYAGLAEEFIREYCEDALKDTSQAQKVVEVAGIFNNFNFDMLKALVEEMNRYGEPPQEALKLLNIKASYEADSVFALKFFRADGSEIERKHVDEERFSGNPLTMRGLHINYYVGSKASPKDPGSAFDDLIRGNDEDEEEDDGKWFGVTYLKEDLKKVDIKAREYVFEKDGIRMVMSRQRFNRGFDTEYASAL